MLGATSRLKGEKDWLKYETARSLHTRIDKIRADYQNDWTSKEMRVRQRGVALYFIDKLALRAGNEKDSDEAADTVRNFFAVDMFSFGLLDFTRSSVV